MSQTPKKYLDYNGLTVFCEKIKELFNTNKQSIESVNSYLTFLKSSSINETSLNNINVNTRLHVVNISSNQNLHLNGTIQKGYDVHIIVKNISNGLLTVNMPTNESSSILICESVYDIEPNKFLEINVISDGVNSYYRVGEQG